MGGHLSSCISANCIQDTHDFSEVLSNSNEIDNTLILDTSIIDVSSDEKKENTPLDVERFRAKITACETLLDESSNSETGSQQSVLSTISPTKDRTISKRSHKNDDDSKMDLIDELNLKNFYRSGESAGTGDKIYGLVASGQKQDLISYAKLNDIDLRTVLFEERWHTCLHVAVVHNQLSMVNYLVDVGVDINAKDKNGCTALGLAYEQSSQDIISVLTSTKAQEFSGSPYSPYALSIVSATHSMRSDSGLPPLQPGQFCRSASFDLADGASVASTDIPSGAWNTPRSQMMLNNSVHSVDQLPPVQKRTVNSPYRTDMTPSAAFEHPPKLQQPQPQSQSQDSVRRRMTMLSESLDRLVHTDRHRSLSLSLPASSPVFAEMKHARSPSAPTALELLFVPLSEDPTPLPARSEDGSQDTGDTGQSAPSGAKEKKVRKPLGTRLRKAAGRAMSLIVPGRGMPPRPKPAAASSRAPIPSHSSTPSGILHPALSIAVDTTTQQEGDTIPSSLVDRLEATVPEEKEDEGDTAAGATLTDLGQLASHTGSPRGGAANDESI